MNKFMYGGSFYPSKQVDHDKIFDWLEKCNINFVRTGEIFGSWDIVESREGVFDFGFLDKFFDQCAERGISILLGTGTASPPLWLHQKYPNINIQDAKGRQYPTRASYSWACHHNQQFLDAAKMFVEKLVQRYQNHPALFAYQIHNEPGYPFMGMDNEGGSDYCYCSSSRESFRHWLKAKYGNSLENLNAAYQWGATSTIYNDWSEVMPPMAKPSVWASVTHWLDFRRWAMDSLTEFISWQNNIIKAHDTTHPTSTNIFFLKSQDPLGVAMGLDPLGIAKSVDVLGYDIYPGSGNKLERMPEFSSICLDHCASMSNYNYQGKGESKGFWLLETEAGPINGWVKGPHRNTSGGDIVRNISDAIGHGATLSLYQLFQELPFQPIHWGGIIDLNGNETPRTNHAIKLGKVLAKYGESLIKSSRRISPIGILISRDNAILANAMGHEDFLVKSIRGCYQVFWEMGFDVNFITTEMIAEGKHNNYTIIVAPFLSSLSLKVANGLKEFVDNGGGLVATSRFGMLDDRGWYSSAIPCEPLEEIFGITAFDTTSGNDPWVTMEVSRKIHKGAWHQDNIKVIHSNTQVLGYFNNDSPAVTLKENVNGGFALFFGTHADVAFLNDGSDLYWDTLKPLLNKKELHPNIEARFANRNNREIDPHILYGSKESWIIINHYVGEGSRSFWNNGTKVCRVWADVENVSRIDDVWTDTEVQFKCHPKGGITFSIDVQKGETLFLKMEHCNG